MKTMEERFDEKFYQDDSAIQMVNWTLDDIKKFIKSELDNVIGEICDYGLDVIESRPDDKDEAYRTGILEMVLHAKSKLKQSK